MFCESLLLKYLFDYGCARHKYSMFITITTCSKIVMTWIGFTYFAYNLFFLWNFYHYRQSSSECTAR